MSTSFLSYRGIIKIKKYKRGKLIKIKEIKNNGTFTFFNTLCNILNKRYNENDLPTFFDLCSKKNSTTSSNARFTSLLNYNPIIEVIDVPTISTDFDGSCSITYRAIVTGAYLNNPLSSSSDDSNIYCVLRDSNGNVLAYSNSGWVINSFNIAIDEVYIIEWKLEFGNYTDTGNTQALKVANNNTTTTSKKSTRKVTKNA